jgi:hypothetical protein
MKIFLLIISIGWFSAHAIAEAPCWHPDSSLLDVLAEAKSEDKAIRDRIVALYAAVHARDWSSVYDFRIASFRDAVAKETFLKSTADVPSVFDGYEVLDYRTYKLGEHDLRKRFIMRFQQGRRTTYDVIWWRLESEVWRVENLGVDGIPLGSAVIGETLQ